jgi:hypothetical protein
MLDIFSFDGFLGDVMTVNLAAHPMLRSQRPSAGSFSTSVSRFFQVGAREHGGQRKPMIQIGCGNLLPHPVTLTQLDEQGSPNATTSSTFPVPARRQTLLVNLCEHQNGRAGEDLSLAAALSAARRIPPSGFIELDLLTRRSR